MRIANVAGRLTVLTPIGGIDVESASAGLFSADPAAVYERWAEFTAWADGLDSTAATPIDEAALGAPSPRPAQVFAIGLNYGAHALEAGYDIPTCRSPSRSSRPASRARHGELADSGRHRRLGGRAGRGGRPAGAARSTATTPGPTSPASRSGRTLRAARADSWAQAPQFSLGKSFPGFGPTGPWLVTPDEFDDVDDLALGVHRQRRADAVGPHPRHDRLGAEPRLPPLGGVPAAAR